VTWLTATEALQVLRVRPQTLYANVSRKKIRAKPDPKDIRRSLYHEVDVRKLARKQGGRRKATVVAAGAIEWGDPVLSSAISTVVDGRLYYRGKDAVGLSDSATLEEIAGLLWGAGAVDFGRAWREAPDALLAGGRGERSGRVAAAVSRAGALFGARVWAAVDAGDRSDARGRTVSEARGRSVPTTRDGAMPDARDESAAPLQRAFYALGQRASVDFSSYGRALPVLQAEAAQVLVTFASAMLEPEGAAPWGGGRTYRSRQTSKNAISSLGGGKRPRGRASRRSVELASGRSLKSARSSDALHERVADAFGRCGAADILRRTLVLVADHELNASTFAARVAASTGAPLSASVLSGLATLSGPLHGRAALGVLELLDSVERLGAHRAVRDWLSQGRPIVGFGHPLYPGGDPRGTALLQHFDLPRPFTDLSEVVEDMIGERPNIDFALAALTKVHRLPPEAPLVLFAIGRCAGWLAHALEQVTTGHPIRPRARYIGPPVSASESISTSG